MKKLSTILIISFLSVFLAAGSAMATFISPISWDYDGETPPNNLTLQYVLDNILATDGSIGLDASGSENDAIANDEVWNTGAVGSNTALVIELSGNDDNNNFGIYDPSNPTTKVQIFAGADSPYTKKSLDIYGDGSVIISDADTGIDFTSVDFGFYLEGPDGTFFSQAALNPESTDQMVAFGPGDGTEVLYLPPPKDDTRTWLASEYILCFEDLYGTYSETSQAGNFSDYDFNDMIVMVESVTPIPEPATMLLLGTGLIGLAGIGRKKFIK